MLALFDIQKKTVALGVLLHLRITTPTLLAVSCSPSPEPHVKASSEAGSSPMHAIHESPQDLRTAGTEPRAQRAWILQKDLSRGHDIKNTMSIPTLALLSSVLTVAHLGRVVSYFQKNTCNAGTSLLRSRRRAQCLSEGPLQDLPSEAVGRQRLGGFGRRGTQRDVGSSELRWPPSKLELKISVPGPSMTEDCFYDQHWSCCYWCCYYYYYHHYHH